MLPVTAVALLESIDLLGGRGDELQRAARSKASPPPTAGRRSSSRA